MSYDRATEALFKVPSGRICLCIAKISGGFDITSRRGRFSTLRINKTYKSLNILYYHENNNIT